jgi:hypothetical protein
MRRLDGGLGTIAAFPCLLDVRTRTGRAVRRSRLPSRREISEVTRHLVAPLVILLR